MRIRGINRVRRIWNSFRQERIQKKFRYLRDRITEKARTLPWNPQARFPISHDNVLISENGSLGIFLITRNQSNKELEVINRFVSDGGKLVCLPMFAGIPKDEYVPAIMASGYTSQEPPPNIRGIPHIQLGAMDFSNSLGRCYPGTGEKKFDFINCTWAANIKEKRWDLAVDLADALCRNYTMVLVAYKGKIPPQDMERLRPFVQKGMLTLYNDFVPKEQFADLMRLSRVGIVNSEWDARPRYLDQLLLCDVPVLLNERIYGGHEMVRGGSGEIVAPDLLAKTAEKMIANLSSYTGMRRRYLQAYGPYNAARRFTTFMNTLLKCNHRIVINQGLAKFYQSDYIRAYAAGLAEPGEFFPGA